jgi:hypothetical protein
MLPRALKEGLTPYLSGERECFATTLLCGVVAAFGIEAMNWDGATIELEVKDDFGVEMPRRVYDKLMALIAAVTTDSVYKDVAIFDETVSALAGDGVGVQKGVPSVDDVAWAVTEIGLVDPDPVTRDPASPWSRNIQKYVRVVLDDEGFTIAPKALEFAGSKIVKNEGFSDPQYYAGAWGSAQERANEVDIWLDSKIVELIQQLGNIGIQLQPAQEKTAAITLDIEKGDTLLFGRYKNSPHVVEEIGTDANGQPTVNGMKLLACRIEKKMPKKAELIAELEARL